MGKTMMAGAVLGGLRGNRRTTLPNRAQSTRISRMPGKMTTGGGASTKRWK